MSIRGMATRGLGAFLGSKIAEETGNSGALGGVAGYGLAMLARRSPLGLATAGAIFLGKKYLDGRKAREAQPVLPLQGGAVNDDGLSRFVDDEESAPAVAATNARDPALAAGG